MTKAELEKEVEKLKGQNEKLKQEILELDNIKYNTKIIGVYISLTNYDGIKFTLPINEITKIRQQSNGYSGKTIIHTNSPDETKYYVMEEYETLLQLFDVVKFKKEKYGTN